jgi:hypothetical protein
MNAVTGIFLLLLQLFAGDPAELETTPADLPRFWVDACDAEQTVDAADRRAVRRRIREACEDLGASADACEALDVVVMRESSGRAAVEHTLGPNERGRGAAGLSVRLHAWKWSAQATEQTLCVPEVSAVVVLRIWRHSVTGFRARTWLDLQRVFAGRFGDVGLPPHRKRDGDWCKRLARREIGCLERVHLRDFGKGPKLEEQEAWLEKRVMAARGANGS